MLQLLTISGVQPSSNTATQFQKFHCFQTHGHSPLLLSFRSMKNNGTQRAAYFDWITLTTIKRQMEIEIPEESKNCSYIRGRVVFTNFLIKS